MIMSKNTDTNVPCHRVIRSNGALGGYNGLRGTKQKLLKKEGTI
jgi:O6-methylguanine-DNA--protein-cysteine methyltransferase